MPTFTQQQIDQVRSKGQTIVWQDSSKRRKDGCGARIWYSSYWNRNSKYGWEIDHISPQSIGWVDNISNLRPLQRENNLSKSDWRLVCKVKSDWTENIYIK